MKNTPLPQRFKSDADGGSPRRCRRKCTRFMLLYQSMPDVFNDGEDLDQAMQLRGIATPKRKVLSLWRTARLIRQTERQGWYAKTDLADCGATAESGALQ